MLPAEEAVRMSRPSEDSRDNLAEPVEVPIPNRSEALVRRTIDPSSVMPTEGAEEEIVTFLSEVLAVRETLSPAAKVRVSVFEPASKVVEPTLTVLKVLTLVVWSATEIVGDWAPPVRVTPVPAVRE